MSQRTISDMISQKPTDTTNPSPSNTPNTRKRSRNYTILNKHGLEGSLEPASPTLSSRTKAPKKASKQPPPITQNS